MFQNLWIFYAFAHRVYLKRRHLSSLCRVLGFRPNETIDGNVLNTIWLLERLHFLENKFWIDNYLELYYVNQEYPNTSNVLMRNHWPSLPVKSLTIGLPMGTPPSSRFEFPLNVKVIPSASSRKSLLELNKDWRRNPSLVPSFFWMMTLFGC